MVTITTVGYGDKTPVTSTGRSMAIGWMFVGLIVYGSVSGLMASAFTEASLAGATSVTLDSMKGKPICTITVYSMFLPKEEGFDTVIHDQNTQSTCVDMVLSGAAAGFFYDSMSLTYLVKNNDTMKKRLLFSDLMVPVGFAPVFPEAGANLTRIDRFQEFNVAVLETLRDYRWFEELFAKWVGTIPSKNYGDPVEVRAAQWKACLGLFVPLLAWIVFYNCAQAWILSKEAPVEPDPVQEQGHEESEWSADILPGQKDHSLPPIDLPPQEDAVSSNIAAVQPDHLKDDSKQTAQKFGKRLAILHRRKSMAIVHRLQGDARHINPNVATGQSDGTTVTAEQMNHAMIGLRENIMADMSAMLAKEQN